LRMTSSGSSSETEHCAPNDSHHHDGSVIAGITMMAVAVGERRASERNIASTVPNSGHKPEAAAARQMRMMYVGWARRLAVAPARRLEVAPLRVG
jgi:hypothetical protein